MSATAQRSPANCGVIFNLAQFEGLSNFVFNFFQTFLSASLGEQPLIGRQGFKLHRSRKIANLNSIFFVFFSVLGLFKFKFRRNQGKIRHLELFRRCTDAMPTPVGGTISRAYRTCMQLLSSSAAIRTHRTTRLFARAQTI